MTEETLPTNTSYELVLIFSPDIGEQKVEKELEEIKKHIKQSDGNVTHEDIWGLREFAYRIKKFDQGFYVILNINLNGSHIREMEKGFNINQDIIRYKFIKTPNNYILKTYEQYQTEWEQQDLEDKKKKEELNESKKPKREKPVTEKEKPAKERVVKEEPKKDQPETVPEKEQKSTPEKTPKEQPDKEEAKTTTTPKLDSDKESKEKLDEVDEKLKSIINDPDISL